MKTKMYYVIAITMLLLGWSCTNNETNNNSNEITLKQENQNLLPYQISHIYIQNGAFTLDQYSATMSDSLVTLHRVNDTTLVFITPLFSSGNKTLKIKVNDKEQVLSYNIIQLTNITDNKQFVTNYVNSCIDSINASQSVITSDTDLASLFQYYTKKSQDNLSTMTSGQLQQLALFIQANYGNTYSSKSKSMKQYSIINEETTKDYAYKYMINYYILNDVVQDMYQANIIKFFTVLPILYIKYFALTYKYKVLFETSMAIAKSTSTDLIGFNEGASVKTLYTPQKVNSVVNSSILSFSNNVSKSFSASSSYRNVNSVDVNSDQTAIIQIINCNEGFTVDATKANDNLLKEKPTKVPANLSAVKEISAAGNIHTNYLTISNISNSKVQLVSFEKSDYKLTLKFKTNESTDQDFTFDLNYNNPGYSKFSKTFVAKLIKPKVFSVEKVSNDSISGHFGQKLNPIKIRIKDVNGNPIGNPDIYMSYTFTTGVGSVTTENTTQSELDNGIYSLDWTLDNKYFMQPMVVHVYSDYLKTELKGSPLTFIAHIPNDLEGTWSVTKYIDASLNNLLTGFEYSSNYVSCDNQCTLFLTWKMKYSNVLVNIRNNTIILDYDYSYDSPSTSCCKIDKKYDGVWDGTVHDNRSSLFYIEGNVIKNGFYPAYNGSMTNATIISKTSNSLILNEGNAQLEMTRISSKIIGVTKTEEKKSLTLNNDIVMPPGK